jgi:hypothetical protein
LNAGEDIRENPYPETVGVVEEASVSVSVTAEEY